MGCRILEDPFVGACFYCSTTMFAFGPIFDDADAAAEFLKWLVHDPRRYNDLALEGLYSTWLHQREGKAT